MDSYNEIMKIAFQAEDARGFFALLEAIASQGHPSPALKGQLSGPVTFAGVVKDAAGKPILYDRELTQAVCAGLARKVAPLRLAGRLDHAAAVALVEIAGHGQQFLDIGQALLVLFVFRLA